MNDAVASGLADALLAGAWHRSHMSLRARTALGLPDTPPWLRAVVAETADLYRDPPLDRPRELAAVLRATRGWTDAPPGLRIVAVSPVATQIVRHPWPVIPLPDLAALARLLDVDQGELAWFADVRGLERRCAPALRHYTRTELPRRGGSRLVAAPKPRLKEIQRRLLRHVLAPIPGA